MLKELKERMVLMSEWKNVYRRAEHLGVNKWKLFS